MIKMHIQHRDYPKDENGYTSSSRYVVISDDDYYIEKENGSFISIRKNNGSKKYIKVVEDKKWEYVYKVQKTQIKAIHGIEGFWKYLTDSREDRSPFRSIAETLVEIIYERVKPAKASEIGGII